MPPSPSDTRSWPRRHKITTGALTLIALSAFGHLVDDGSGNKAQSAATSHSSPAPKPATSQPSVAKTTASATIPNVVGMSFGEAQSRLDKMGVTASEVDASPLGRYVTENKDYPGEWGEWVVTSSSAKPGTPASAVKNMKLTVLKKKEAAWYAKHPTMPALPAGKEVYDLTEDGQALDGMRDLVLCLYPKGAAPSYASPPSNHTDGSPATPMLPSETAPVEGLAEGSTMDLLVRPIPAAGEKVRPGRLLYMLVRDQYADTTSDGTSTGDSNVHDYDMPNHLPNLPGGGHHHWGGGHHSWWH